MTVFIRVVERSVEEKSVELLRAVASIAENTARPPLVYEREPTTFSVVPGSPFAYWVSESVRGAFKRFDRFECSSRTVKQGLVTSDDARFLRAWWEAPERGVGRTWFGFAKGGSYSPFYADVFLLVDWRDHGRQSWAIYEARRNVVGGIIKNPDHYFRPGLTWPRRTNGLSFRVLPSGCIFADKGPSAFVERDDPEMLLALCGLMNARAFGYLVSVQLARTELAQSYEVGLIQQTPIPALARESRSTLARFARRAWSLGRSLDTIQETSHAFLLPGGLIKRALSLDEESTVRELTEIQSQIDDLVFQLYGVDTEDRASIDSATKHRAAGPSWASEPADDGEEAENGPVLGDGWERLCSWLVGVAFGRFDPRLATGERAVAQEPEPFEPLPSRSAGMYPEGEEPADRPKVLVDDEGHPDDLAARTQAVADLVEIDVPENLRGWLARELFGLHIRMYSRSRRKAPIYWQLATPSVDYSVWLYCHAFGKDTLFRVQNDYVAPKLAHEERRLEALADELRGGGTASQTRALAEQEAFVEELRTMLDDVKRVAPLWNPNLDDGVIINFAPLWRLVPQNKPWQKELKSTWDRLCEGEYDWSHLAMHLWPERVVPKCARDRSLAVAHGLESVFWSEGGDGKWSPRKVETRSVDELVRERTSAAVKAALKSLLDAPIATGAGGRGRSRRRGPPASDRGEEH